MRKLSEAGAMELKRRLCHRTYAAGKMLDDFLVRADQVLDAETFDRTVGKIVRTLDFLDADLK